MSVASLVRRATGGELDESLRGVRPDIQALRAIAVGSVLVYHLTPGHLTGGYIGVDVFFVISGFLITSHLLREVDRTGRLRLGLFWTRRARRLLPSSLLVLAATTAAIVLLLPSGHWDRALGDVAGSALYFQNWRLAALSVDYLGANATASPVQHFWTLSVEEQFYVAVPVLLLLALWLSRVTRLNRRFVMSASIGAVAVVSLYFSIKQTPWTAAAYFTTHTRAWEFAVGALIAFVPPLMRMKHATTGVGVAGIAVSALLFTDKTSFPGSAALLPVLGAALALWAGRETWLTWVGKLVPVAAVGRSSYAIYLWHWPLIVLVPHATGEDLTFPIKVAIGVAALALGWLTTVLWEEPVRFSPKLLGGRSPRVVAMWCAGATILVIVATQAVLAANEHRRDVERAGVAQTLADLQATGCAGAASMVNPDCDPLAPARMVLPALDGLADDVSWVPGCWGTEGGSKTLALCQVGNGVGPTFLVLGDSHATALTGVYELLAAERGWTFLLSGYDTCYATTGDLYRSDDEKRLECDAWRVSALETIAAGDYDALIVTHFSGKRVVAREGLSIDESEILGLAEAWAMRPSTDTPVIAIRDNPIQNLDIDVCLEREGPGGGVECGLPAKKALLPDLQSAAVEADPNAYLIDLTDLYCVADECPVIIGGLVVYRPDGEHLAGTFSDTMAPMIGDRIESILREQGIPDEKLAENAAAGS